MTSRGPGEARDGVERRQAGEPRVARQDAAVAQVHAEDRIGQAIERVGVGQRLGPDDDAMHAEVEQRPRPLRLADPGIDHDARLARQRGDDRASERRRR